MTNIIRAPKAVAPDYLEWLRRDRMGGQLVTSDFHNPTTRDTETSDGLMLIQANGMPDMAGVLSLTMKKPTHFAQYALYFGIGFREIRFASEGGTVNWRGMPKRAMKEDLFILQYTPFNNTWDIQSYSTSPYAFIFTVPPEGMMLQEAPYHRTCYRYAGATPTSITVPKSTTTSKPIGYFVEFIKQAGDGALSIAPEDSSVIINTPASGLTLPGKGSRCSLMKVGTDEWDMSVIPA